MVMVLYGKMMLGTTVRKGPNLICLHGIYVFFFLFTCYIYLLFFFSIMFVCTTHVDLVVPWLGL